MKTEFLLLEKYQLKEGSEINLPPSKSESNRCLILNALSGGRGTIENLSSSDDTLVLQKALRSSNLKINIGDAGTSMRFLAAFYAITNQHKILGGSQRLNQRPVKELVGALQSIGAKIRYSGRKGFPPLEIEGFKYSGKKRVKVKADISSQFISALMMIGPLIPNGLNIVLEGRIVSKPYIYLTRDLMRDFGVQPQITRNSIRIPESKYQHSKIKVDGDWSAASYWYSLFRISSCRKLTLKGIQASPRQGDAAIISMMKGFGVQTVKVRGGYVLTKKDSRQKRTFDFLKNPDLAQTIIVLCAVLGIKAKFRGLDTLSIKETDRIKALQKELKKIGCSLKRGSGDFYTLTPGVVKRSGLLKIRTYNDHRMAMAFAPLCLLTKLAIENPGVVTKSYPEFWNQLHEVTD